MERAKRSRLVYRITILVIGKNLLEPRLGYMLQKIKAEVALVLNGPDEEVRLDPSRLS
jgi:hypothetical protein